MGLLGVFMARDWALLYVFWELTLVPLFFLIDHWGGRRRHLASLNFVVYTMGGAVFILTALLMIYTHSPVHSTLMDSMEVSAQALDTRQQVVILLLFLVGFGVKLPVFPLHGWLPLAHVEAPASVSILLSGIMLKMGAYGLLRIYAMLPDAVILCQPLLAGLSVFGVLYGALLAWRQSDFKSQIAYGSISHMGWVMLGLTMLTPLSISGAWLQMIAHGLVTAPLFLMAGMLYEKKHSRELASYAGLVKEAPRAATLISLALLMSLGLPSTLGFIAEIRIMMGTWPSLTYGILLPCLATLIAAVYVFRTIGIFFQHGDPHILAAHDAMTDLSSTELAGLLLVLGLSLACGLYPDVLHDYLQASLGAYLATFTLS
jgi:NADH-quinone oxidoreductase subunit M